MAYKVSENKKFSLSERILTTIGEMQPISSDEIRFEIEEDEDRALSKIDVNHHLEEMLENNLLAEVTLKNGRKGYIRVKQ